MSRLALAAHVVLDPPPADWRELLAHRLGTRPRRIGGWAELALLGARLCLDAAQEERLPQGALLRVVGTHGPMAATRLAAEQARHGLPLPFSFMQSQPSQMLAAVSQHLQWRGDARYVLGRDLHATLQLAQLECTSPAAGLLIGTVEEDRCTTWWRYRAM